MDQSIDGLSARFGSNRERRRNFTLGLINGVGFRLAESLVDPPIVLTWFVRQLTESNLLIGLVSPLGRALWSLPQIFFAGHLQRLSHKMPVYRVSATIRLSAWFALAGVVWFVDDPVTLLVSFFLLYSVSRAVGAPGGLVFYDVVAKTIPPRRRGSFFAWRQLLGGLLGLVGGLVVKSVLDSPTFPFPRGYALLFLMCGVSLVVGMGGMLAVREPAGAIISSSVTFRQLMRRAGDLLRDDPVYRRYTITQISLQMSNLAQPFLVVFAIDHLGAPDGMVGIYVTTRIAALLLANLFWGALSDRRGNRLVLQLLCLGNGLVQVLALAMILGFSGVTRVPGEWLPYTALPALFLSGAMIPAHMMAGANFLLELVDETERPLYLGFYNSVIGIVVLISGFGGLLLDSLGFTGLFAIALALCLIAYGLSRGLPEPRDTRVLPETG